MYHSINYIVDIQAFCILTATKEIFYLVSYLTFIHHKFENSLVVCRIYFCFCWYL